MKTISRIAYSNDKRNRTRSILIMMAICLTTMLLVIISTVGNGVIHLQKSQAAGSYGSNYGLFVSADGSQLKEVNRRAEIDATGTMCTEGIIKGNEKGGFVCMDETARKMLPYNKEYELKEGKYPEKMQEIAAGRAFFLPFRFPFLCVSAFSKYRVASIGEIRETIFIGLRSAKATVKNDTKIHRSITGRENSGIC